MQDQLTDYWAAMDEMRQIPPYPLLLTILRQQE
jgi:hypothetical protein